MPSALFSNYSYSEQALTVPDYDFIYLSPHLDDVALSCSGTICQQKAQGHNILVVTVFVGDPQPPFSAFAQAIHRTWKTSSTNPYTERKQEDRQAMAALGSDYLWLDCLEIIYRAPELSGPGELFCEPGDPIIHPQDATLFSLLCHWLADLRSTYPRAHIVAPLSLGMHRDHRLVFQAALSTLTTLTTLASHHLLFYEDFPYVTYVTGDLSELVQSHKLTPIEIDISPYLQQRIHITELYQSQLPTLYTPTSFPDLIKDYTHALGNQQRYSERYWKIS